MFRVIAFSAAAIGVSSAIAHADTAVLTCLESHYDQANKVANTITHYVVFEKAKEASSAHLQIDDKTPDAAMVEISETTIKAKANDTDMMPVPSRIDACLAHARKVLSGHTRRVSIFDYFGLIEECQYRAGLSPTPVPITLDVTINRITGDFKSCSQPR
jgi:hypothetical protein